MFHIYIYIYIQTYSVTGLSGSTTDLPVDLRDDMERQCSKCSWHLQRLVKPKYCIHVVAAIYNVLGSRSQSRERSGKTTNLTAPSLTAP